MDISASELKWENIIVSDRRRNYFQQINAFHGKQTKNERRLALWIEKVKNDESYSYGYINWKAKEGVSLVDAMRHLQEFYTRLIVSGINAKRQESDHSRDGVMLSIIGRDVTESNPLEMLAEDNFGQFLENIDISKTKYIKVNTRFAEFGMKGTFAKRQWTPNPDGLYIWSIYPAIAEMAIPLIVETAQYRLPDRTIRTLLKRTFDVKHQL